MKLQWSKINAGPMTWDEAVEYCNSLQEDGHNDWRLPDIKELISIVNYKTHYPATDLEGMLPEHYWSSTTHSSNTVRAWGVDFYYGDVYGGNKSSSSYVRAVRKED